MFSVIASVKSSTTLHNNKKRKPTYLYRHIFLLRQATPHTFSLLSFPVWSALFTLSLIWASFIPPLWSCTWLWSAWLGTLPFLLYNTKDTARHCSLSPAKSRQAGMCDGSTFFFFFFFNMQQHSPVCLTPFNNVCRPLDLLLCAAYSKTVIYDMIL